MMTAGCIPAIGGFFREGPVTKDAEADPTYVRINTPKVIGVR